MHGSFYKPVPSMDACVAHIQGHLDLMPMMLLSSIEVYLPCPSINRARVCGLALEALLGIEEQALLKECLG